MRWEEVCYKPISLLAFVCKYSYDMTFSFSAPAERCPSCVF